MKKIGLFLSMLLISVGVNAQLLWKISGGDLAKPSYLFGTEHVAPVSVLDSFPGFDLLVAEVDALYGELSLDDVASAAMSPEIAMMMMAPADSTLSRVMSPAELHEVDSVFMSLTGAPTGVTAMLEPYKPVMLATMMLQIAASKSIPGFDMQNPLDFVILKKGVAAGKPVKGLETMKEQVKLLYGDPISKQVRDLLESIRIDKPLSDYLLEMNEAYLAGNLTALYDMMIDEKAGMDADTQKRMIAERNSAWVSFLLGMLPTSSALIVVGAGHLPGSDGLLQLFRNAGYNVEPVNKR